MKVRTNLSAKELRRVAKGLEVLASKASDVFVASNEIEDKLFNDIDDNFDKMSKSLIKDISRIVKE